MKIFFISFFLSSTYAKPENVCYDHVGCFTTEYPWHIPRYRPSRLPWSPRKIRTEFRLQNLATTGYELLNSEDIFELKKSHFSKHLETIITVHGWNTNSEGNWQDVTTQNIKEVLGAVNIITVDWRAGAQIADYYQSASNTQVVGREIGFLLSQLKKANLLDDFSTVMISGHSLGAQVAGYAGKWTKKITGKIIGRISAMDPAGPYFELPDSVPANQRHEVHLWREDADFVDVIHTTAGDIWEGDIALGMKTAVGHADFFPNGGAKNQPGCHQINCHHGRSHKYWNSSIRRNCFQAIHCDSWEHYLGKCENHVTNSNRMGYWAHKPVVPQSFYLETSKHEPWCHFE